MNDFKSGELIFPLFRGRAALTFVRPKSAGKVRHPVLADIDVRLTGIKS